MGHLEPPFAFEFSGIALLYSVFSKRQEKERMAKAMCGSNMGVLKVSWKRSLPVLQQIERPYIQNIQRTQEVRPQGDK